jgi:protein-S-isoprenylcysteine O-methyltransferase Ste14
MGVLRMLVDVTWAVWIWTEAVVVLGPTLVDQLRGRGRRQDIGSTLVLLGCVVAAFVAAIRLQHLAAGALPGSLAGWLAGGLALMWSGLGLRVWAIDHAGGLFHAVVVVPRDHRLVTTGPYRLVRHPSYTGALLTAAGFGLTLGHWTSLLVLVVGWSAGLAYRIRVEEGALRRAFGTAYDEYRARTRRLIPHLF